MLGAADVRDANNRASNISSDVNNVGLLTTDNIVLFKAVDCS
jgi:hypothetical protein